MVHRYLLKVMDFTAVQYPHLCSSSTVSHYMRTYIPPLLPYSPKSRQSLPKHPHFTTNGPITSTLYQHTKKMMPKTYLRGLDSGQRDQILIRKPRVGQTHGNRRDPESHPCWDATWPWFPIGALSVYLSKWCKCLYRILAEAWRLVLTKTMLLILSGAPAPSGPAPSCVTYNSDLGVDGARQKKYLYSWFVTLLCMHLTHRM